MKSSPISFQSKTDLELWRWLLLPLLAPIGAFLGTGLIILFLWVGMRFFGGFDHHSWHYQYVYGFTFVSSVVFGWLYVLCIYTVAPHGKFISAVFMVFVLVFFAAINLVLAWVNPVQSIDILIQKSVGTVSIALSAAFFTISYKAQY